jgi:hypothetical protein
MFAALKANQDEPDAAAAALVGVPVAGEHERPLGLGSWGTFWRFGCLHRVQRAQAAPVLGACQLKKPPRPRTPPAGGQEGGGQEAAAVGGSAGPVAPPHRTASPSAGGLVHAPTVLNQPAHALLRRLPGVTEAGARGLMSSFESLAQVVDAPVAALERAMGSARAAAQLREFLDAPCPHA